MIGRILQDKEMLESDLSFEIGTLMQAAFIYLDTPTQDAVMARILTLRDNEVKGDRHPYWILKKRAELIVTIPCYLRSPKAQALLNDYEKENGVLIRRPDIKSRSGWVSAPFSFEVFHRNSDSGVLRLLAHYSGFKKDSDEFLVGGERGDWHTVRQSIIATPKSILALVVHSLGKYFRKVS